MQNYASDILLYAQLRTIRWLSKYQLWGMYFVATFTFVVHTAWYCMDAVYLNGNVWIYCLYAQISVSCESMTVQLSV